MITATTPSTAALRAVSSLLETPATKSLPKGAPRIPGILRAIKAAGTQTALADALGVSQQAVQKWARQGWAPVDRAIEIENMYGIPRRDLVKPKLRDLLEPPVAAFEEVEL